MKAKDYLKSKGLKNPPLDSGISGGGDAPRIYASDIIEEYARIQIEKDRIDAANNFSPRAITQDGQIKQMKSIIDRPINLD